MEAVTNSYRPNTKAEKRVLAGIKNLVKETIPEMDDSVLSKKLLRKLLHSNADMALSFYHEPVFRRQALLDLVAFGMFSSEKLNDAVHLYSNRALINANMHHQDTLATNLVSEAITISVKEFTDKRLMHLNQSTSAVVENFKIAYSVKFDELTKGFSGDSLKIVKMDLMRHAIILNDIERALKTYSFLKQEWCPKLIGSLEYLDPIDSALQCLMTINLRFEEPQKSRIFECIGELISVPSVAYGVLPVFVNLTNMYSKEEASFRAEKAISALKNKIVQEKLFTYTGRESVTVSFWTGHLATAVGDQVENVARGFRLMDKVGYKEIGQFDSKGLIGIFDYGLDVLINKADDLRALYIYLNSGPDIIPMPSLFNMPIYKETILEIFKEKYGFNMDVSLSDMCLISTYWNTKKFGSMQQVLNLISSGDRSPKFYPLKKNGEFTALNLGQDELIRYCVICVLGSRNKEDEAHAKKMISQIVSIDTINKARTNTSNAKKVMKDNFLEFREGKPDYPAIYSKLWGTNDEVVKDVLNAANYKDISIKNANFLFAAESKNPLDFSSEIQSTCTYLPTGSGIFDYVKDENTIMIKYSIGSLGKDEKPPGSSISYIAGDTFIQDSVEGHRVIREKKDVFRIIYEDFVERATERGLKKIFFSTAGANLTAIEFAKYVGTLGLPITTLGIKLKPLTKSYLETKANTKGYLLDLELIKQTPLAETVRQ